jgi:hypothetical protein
MFDESVVAEEFDSSVNKTANGECLDQAVEGWALGFRGVRETRFVLTVLSGLPQLFTLDQRVIPIDHLGGVFVAHGRCDGTKSIPFGRFSQSYEVPRRPRLGRRDKLGAIRGAPAGNHLVTKLAL